MTEAEAKGKWCPAARVLLPVNQTGNRVSTAMKAMAAKSSASEAEWYAQQEADCRCIGSQCMAWLWSETPNTPTEDELGRNKLSPGNGYCGLVGVPTP